MGRHGGYHDDRCYTLVQVGGHARPGSTCLRASTHFVANIVCSPYYLSRQNVLEVTPCVKKSHLHQDKHSNREGRNSMGNSDKLSRRIFLANAGKLAAGAAAGAAGLSLAAVAQVPSAAAADVPQWPWPYKKLDPEAVYWKAYAAYYQGGCSYATFGALVSEAGAPFNTVPAGMMRFGEGGVVGWGSHCGALTGSSAFIGLAYSDPAVYSKLINELTLWYTEQLGSGSPLCHISVTEWSKANGVKVESQERKDRCARVSGEVAKKAVLLLNSQADNQFQAQMKVRPAVVGCLTCHGKNGMENVRAGVAQDCTSCHGKEPHRTATQTQ